MTSLAIQTYGEGSPLVLFHGWGFDRHIWRSWIPCLLNMSVPHQIYIVDLPGFGDSPSMSWESFKTELLNRLPTTFALLGWSLGGLFASRLVVEMPHRVSCLINLASSPYFIRDNDWAGVATSSLDDFCKQFEVAPHETRKHFIRTQVGNHSACASLEEPTPCPLNKDGLSHGLHILKNWDLRQDLHEVTIPVHYVFGRLDVIVPRKVMHIMQHTYPKFKYTLLHDAAHMPFLSHPQDVISAIEASLC